MKVLQRVWSDNRWGFGFVILLFGTHRSCLRVQATLALYSVQTLYSSVKHVEAVCFFCAFTVIICFRAHVLTVPEVTSFITVAWGLYRTLDSYCSVSQVSSLNHFNPAYNTIGHCCVILLRLKISCLGSRYTVTAVVCFAFVVWHVIYIYTPRYIDSKSVLCFRSNSAN
jgi:hypothetical protein